VNNLVQTATNAVTPDLITKLSGLFGESPMAITKGLGASVPAALAAEAQRSASPGGASGLLDMLGQSTRNGNPLDRLPEALSNDGDRAAMLSQGTAQAESLFGPRAGGITNALSSFSGLRAGSASGILALAVPLSMGAIGKALGGAPSAPGLTNLLADQRPSILGALPSGVSSVLGLGGGGAAPPGRATIPGAAERVEGGVMRRLWPWLIAAAIVLALFLIFRNLNRPRTETAVAPLTPAPATAVPAPTAVAPAVTAPTTVETTTVEAMTLPNGSSVSVAPGSIGYDVAKFLASADAAPKSFLFDNLNFDTAATTLTPESTATVTSLTEILKAYPNARARIVGYTDNQGDPASNKTLSENRAASVAQRLTQGGVPSNQLETAGMGEASPIADNSSEAGRAQNRRTELVIVKK
jgi:outer membrane protein OmpA-like peptidoglycan-associated protein